MKEDFLKRWGQLSPGKLTACSGAVLLVLAGCGGGHGSGATESELDKSAEQQEIAAAQAHDPSVDVKYDNWLDDPSLPTPPSAEPQVSLKAPAPNTSAATEAAATAPPGTASAKIVGGSGATETYPFMAALLVNGNLNCGGTLIAPTWVLTAAGCVSGMSPSTLSVRLNSLNRSSGGQVIRVTETRLHPLWNPQNYQPGNDIALVRLASAASGITPVPIAPLIPAPNIGVRTLGWGQTKAQRGADGGSTTLKQLDSRTTDNFNCPSWASGDLCVVATTAAAACFGDAGGPALVRYNGAWNLIGPFSRLGNQPSSTCGTGNSLYASATLHQSWILQQINSAAQAPAPAPAPVPPPPPAPAPPPPPPASTTAPCTNCTKYTATLTQGQTQVQPNGSYVNSATGLLRGWMTSPAGTDFDLALYRYTGSAWALVIASAGPGNQEMISFSGQPGYYYWSVRADMGSGAYTLYLQNP